MHGDAEELEGGIRQGVGVVVVNYRTRELTAEAVRSVLPERLVEEVVVVDNGSGDGSVDFLRATFSQPVVHIAESPTNLGFAGGANLGVAMCKSPFVFLLNSDAVVRPRTIARLRRVLTDDPSVGVVAPAVYLADGKTLQPDAYGPLPKPGARLRTTARRSRLRTMRDSDPPGWVSGAAMMLRRADFVALGGFDPHFTMYLEDVDLCRRLKARGKRVVREPAGSVIHLGGASSAARTLRFDQFHRSKEIYLRKVGAGRVQLGGAAALRVARLAVERIRAWRQPHA